MTWQVYDEKGELQVETTDTSKLEFEQLTLRDLLVEILLEQRKTNLHLSILSHEDVTRDDVRRAR